MPMGQKSAGIDLVKPLRTLRVLPSCFAGALMVSFFIAAHPVLAELQLDEAIPFVAEDFEGTDSAMKPWIIYPRGEEPTKVWSMQNARIAPLGGDARLSILNNVDPDSEIVWKIVTPEGTRIASFVWGVSHVFLDSPASSMAHFSWEYSLDGSKWVEFFTIANRKNAGGSPTILTNQEYPVEIDSPSSNVLFIRARNTEKEITGATSYFAVFSVFPNGGESSSSFVSVTLAK